MGPFLASRIRISYSFWTKMIFSAISYFLTHFYLLFSVFSEKHYFVVPLYGPEDGTWGYVVDM